jgi:hypothetical protein
MIGSTKCNDALDTVARCLADIRALERYLLEVVELQRAEDALSASEEGSRLVEETKQLLQSHVERVDRHLSHLEGARDCLRNSTALMAGAFIGFFSKNRAHEPAKMLRDDYTLLNLASASYLILHTTAVALRDESTAELALTHHRELTPLIADIARALPSTVIRDLTARFGGIDRTAAERTAGVLNELTPITAETTLAATA